MQTTGKYLWLLALLPISFLFSQSNQDQLLLYGQWYYAPSSANPMNRAQWVPLKMPGRLEDSGVIPHSSVSRIIFVFTLKKIPNSYMRIHLGRIRSADKTLLNGRLIGQTGSLPPTPMPAYDKERNYFVSPGDWKVGENILMIQIWHPRPFERAGILANYFYLAQPDEFESELFQRTFSQLLLCLTIFFTGVFILFLSTNSLGNEQYLGVGAILLASYMLFFLRLPYQFFDHFVLQKKLELLTLFLLPIPYFRYFLWGNRFRNNLFYFFYIAEVMSAIWILTRPTLYASLFYLPYWRFGFILAASLLIPSMLQDRRNRFADFRWLVGSCVVLLLVGLKDILFFQQGPPWLPYGGLAFVLLQWGAIYKKRTNLAQRETLRAQVLENLSAKRSQVSNPDQLLHEYLPILQQVEGVRSATIVQNLPHNLDKSRRLLDFGAQKILLLLDSKKFLHKDARLLAILERDIRTNIETLQAQNRLARRNKRMRQIIEIQTRRIRKKSSEIIEKARDEHFLMQSLSHDIKTPMSMVNILLDNIIRKYPLESELRLKLLKVKFHSYKIIEIMQTLLQHQRMRKIASTVVSSDIVLFVHRQVSIFRDSAESFGNQIVFESNIETHECQFSPFLVERVLNNLLCNAIRYSSGKIILRLEVKRGEAVTIEMENPVHPENATLGGFIRQKSNNPFSQYYPSSGTGLRSLRKELRKNGGMLNFRIERSTNATAHTRIRLPIQGAAKQVGSYMGANHSGIYLSEMLETEAEIRKLNQPPRDKQAYPQ